MANTLYSFCPNHDTFPVMRKWHAKGELFEYYADAKKTGATVKQIQRRYFCSVCGKRLSAAIYRRMIA